VQHPGNDDAWTGDAAVRGEVESQFRAAINAYMAQPLLIQEHAGLEESMRTGGYANRTLLELVQNSSDAMLDAERGPYGASGRVEIVLDPDKRVLYCANAGRPFAEKGVRAITQAYLSAKRGDEIGRFGLGFKSVLAVSYVPEVFSRSVCFGFNSPEAIAAITEVAARTEVDANVKKLPILRTPTLLDPYKYFDADPILADLAKWATTIVRLPQVEKLEHLVQQIKDFQSEFLLFVSSVREIKLRILGTSGLETSHISRALGGGLLRIERPDGTGDEWITESRMHQPSKRARDEVGDTVARGEVKVTIAMPVKHSQRRVGEFWSYFPLQDTTSASAIFNAPWSVNDDRTTLLEREYNREILVAFAEMFVDLLPRVSSDSDPAAHLDYLPARGREERLQYGANQLATLIPQRAAEFALIPDATGLFRFSRELRPLDLGISIDLSARQEWSESPNTGDDVPHWRCYTTTQRAARLRTQCAIGSNPNLVEEEGRDMKQALETMPKRGLLSWLREWAEGDDLASAADALRFVVGNSNLPDIGQAKVIPTSGGLKSLDDRNVVFLESEDDLQFDGGVFVDPGFLAQPGVSKMLRDSGFTNLDPSAVLNARLAGLGADSTDEQLSKFWEAASRVPARDASALVARARKLVRVPTMDGDWQWPQQVVDLGEPLSAEYGRMLLDRSRCVPDVAHTLGVVRGPIKDFSYDDEFARADYEVWALNRINSALGSGERRVDRIKPWPKREFSPGPFSILFALRDAGASTALREQWTRELLEFGDTPWQCEDVDSGTDHPAPSPVRWAVELAGLVNSTRGMRAPSQVVSPVLGRYRDFLPLFVGPSSAVKALDLPAEIGDVPKELLREALEGEVFPSTVDDSILFEFITSAVRIGFDGSLPRTIPAHVGRTIEAKPPKSVFVAVDEEQREFLAIRQRPYLFSNPDGAEELVELVGCQRFEDTFSFSLVVEGAQDPDPILDVFPGFRGSFAGNSLTNASLTRAAIITKRVATADGVEDQSLQSHLDGLNLFVENTADSEAVLSFVNQAFDLRLTNAELTNVRQAGLTIQLEKLRQQAKSATNDVERLEIYFGEDSLREELPRGLWQALESQDLVDSSTSVAELFLTVYGVDALKQLRELFRQEGFSDVPNTWVGGGATITWLRQMGFGPEYAGRRADPQEAEFTVPGKVNLTELHPFQQPISTDLREVLATRDVDGRAKKAMVELPTGAGKTRVATETVLRLFAEDVLHGTVLWIAQSQELCEQAVQTFSLVWRGIGDERPLTIGRLWDGNNVHRPDTEFSVIVATDAMLDSVRSSADYEWLSDPAAVFIDEGHRAGDSTRYTRLLNWLGVDGRGWARPLVGLSATPFRGTSDDATKRLAARFGGRRIAISSDNPYRELADQGFLARVQHKVLSGVAVNLTAQERRDAETLRRVNPAVLDRIGQDQARMATLVDDIMTLDESWPVLVFTPSVLSAQVLAATLRYRGVVAESVSGQTGRQQRRAVIDRFQRNEIRVLTNCDLLIQGFDAPGVRALYIARPTFSSNAYIQMAGRGLRGLKNGGKEECLIVDLVDNFGDINEFLGFRDYERLWTEQQR